jgi:hypothetical protein
MTAYRMQGLLFVFLGLVSGYESWQINETVRPTGNFDAIGPDRYLALLSVIMVVVGLWLAVRPPQGGGAASDWSDLRRWPPAHYLVVLAILTAFVWAMPWTGFVFGSLFFFILMYRLLGGWSWLRTLSYAAITTIFIYVIFVYVSDLPMPKSFLGI